MSDTRETSEKRRSEIRTRPVENEQTPEALAHEVAAHPTDALYGKLTAVATLSEMGAPAVAAVLTQMRQPCPAGQHSRDVIEALGYVLNRIARVDSQPVLDAIALDAVPPDPVLLFLVFALDGAPRTKVVPTLCLAAKHRNEFVRWAAVSVLAHFGTKDTAEAITGALRDRSHMVKSEAVDALRKKKRLRTPAVVEPLRRIVANSVIRKHSPGLWDSAQVVLFDLTGEVGAKAAK
jgi:HEAT repeat protein